MRELGMLAAGSVAGGFARYGVWAALTRVLGTGFPYGTLAANVLGGLAIGVLDGASQGRWKLSEAQRLLLVTGFCGGFTTFSAFLLETDQLLRAGLLGRAAGYVAVSLVLGFGAFRLGSLLGR